MAEASFKYAPPPPPPDPIVESVELVLTPQEASDLLATLAKVHGEYNKLTARPSLHAIYLALSTYGHHLPKPRRVYGLGIDKA